MRHTVFSRSLLLIALVPALVGLMLGNVTLLLVAGAIVLAIVRVRDARQTEADIDSELDTERCQRSKRVDAQFTASLPDGNFVGIAHQPLPETFLLCEGSNVHALEPGTSLDQTVTIASPKRGAWDLDPARVDAVHPLMLAPPNTIGEAGPRELTVEPTVRPLRTVKGLRAPATEGIGEDPSSRGPASTEFEELREYNKGDPLKFVNWKATAKQSDQKLELIVNEYEPEARKNVWFFLDVHRDLEVGTTLNTALEDGIDVTLALVHHFLGRGHRVGGTTYNTENEHTFYPDAGSRQELIIARRLARVERGCEYEGLPGAVERVKGFLAREQPLVFVVTRPDANTDALLEGVRRIQTHAGTARQPTPVHVLAPEPPMGTPEDELAHALATLEAGEAVGQASAPMLRVHRLQDGAKGLEKALAKGAMAQ